MAIPTSVRITKSNLFTQSLANVYNLINTRTNVPLPTGLPTDHKYVYIREPFKMGRGFGCYPYIIVSPSEIDQREKLVSATKGNMMYHLDVKIVAQDKSSDSSGIPSGAEMLNTISDDVIETLNGNYRTLINNGLKHLEFGTIYDWTEEDGKVIFMRQFTLTFNAIQAIA